MNDQLTVAWIRAQHAEHGSSEWRAVEWAVHEVNMLCLSDPQRAWERVASMYEATEDEWIHENLGAGPLETLLAISGDAVFPLMKPYMKAHPGFSKVLAHVWLHALPAAMAQELRPLL